MNATTLNYWLIIVFLLQAVSIFSQAPTIDKSIEQQFYQAYITNELSMWETALSQLEKEQRTNELFLAKGYYGAAHTAMGNDDENAAKQFLKKGEALANQLLKNDEKNAEANALLSGVLGMQIALSPMKGMFLGSKSSKLATKGIKINGENAFANLLKGNSLYYTPKIYGGNVAGAIPFLEKAKTIYEDNGQVQTWEYLSTLALLGQAYHNQEAYKAAKATYEIALDRAPNFGYVKYVLLPETQEAIK